MKNDKIYYANKQTFRLYELGEIVAGFNMSFAIDGTKDSSKVEVWSMNGNVIDPYTIIFHKNTSTWWIATNDRVERYRNEEGYVYKHSLQIQGAIELLNARDLTDCGFYQNRYTIEDIFNKLIKLSSFEFPTPIITSGELNLDQNVDYVKTFENYTLLSALRELFDAYNCAIKLEFTYTEDSNQEYMGHITNAIFIVVSKTGLTTNVINDSVFNNVKEIKNINKNSYGNVVMSNAENVISSKAKIYPSVGYVKLKSNEREINYNNAILRLPSNIYKVNYLQIVQRGTFYIRAKDGSWGYLRTTFVYSDDEEDIKNELQKMMAYVYDPAEIPSGYYSAYPQWAKDIINANIDDIAHKIALSMRTTLYSGWRYDAINNLYIAPNDNPDFYFPMVRKKQPLAVESVYYGKCVICERNVRDTIQYKTGVCCYEKGKDTIEMFNFLSNNDLEYHTDFVGYGSTDYRVSADEPMFFDDVDSQNREVQMWFNPKSLNTINVENAAFRVNYIPMTDVKIKYDNSSTGNDLHLYNQNGKLNDSNSLSKLMLSYSKEIETDSITKYAEFNTFASVPSVGQRVIINDIIYVINNVSLDFYQNENNSYYIVGEFSLSRSIAVKSLMVNPNTDIRDYGIPQQFNVKRKQLYRDFYELSKAYDSNADSDYYLYLDKVLNLTEMYKPYAEHTAVMKLTYSMLTGGNTSDDDGTNDPEYTWYYQLDSTVYYLKKAIYEVIDFKDNNIIGYSSMNSTSGFDVSKIFTGMAITINTPITYCDDNGEVESFEICMCNTIQLSNIYETYQGIIEQQQGTTYDGRFINDFFFIPSEIYEGEVGNLYGAKDNCDFKINELTYEKDATEVPVFEYSCQIDDSDTIIVGDNILDNDENDMFYVYKIITTNSNTRDNNNWDYGLAYTFETALVLNINSDNQHYSRTGNIVKFEYNGNYIEISLYQVVDYNYDTRQVIYRVGDSWQQLINNSQGKDLIVCRLAVPNNYKTKLIRDYNYVVAKPDLMFIIKDIGNYQVDNNKIRIAVNHYKIK